MEERSLKIALAVAAAVAMLAAFGKPGHSAKTRVAEQKSRRVALN